METKCEKHTADYVKKLIIDVLEKYDVNKFSCIVTDNAANMRKATRDIEDMYPHITSFGCFAHTLHLICNDILQIPAIRTLMTNVKTIIKLITRTQVLVAKFHELKKELKIDKSLHLPVCTRWGSHVMALESLIDCKNILQRIVIDPTVAEKIDKKIRHQILNEDKFWPDVIQLKDLLKPITIWITRQESDKPTIHLVYRSFDEIQSHLSNHLKNMLRAPELNAFVAKLNDRQLFSVNPIHYAADFLDPDPNYSTSLNEDQRSKAVEYIEQVATFLNLNNDNLLIEIGKYLSKHSKQGIFGDSLTKRAAEKVDILTFWGGFCKDTTLSKIAVRILSMPSTSAAVERSFSSQSLIHTKRRNRLTTTRAIKLNYVRHNSRLLGLLGINKDSRELSETETVLADLGNKVQVESKCEKSINSATCDSETVSRTTFPTCFYLNKLQFSGILGF